MSDQQVVCLRCNRGYPAEFNYCPHCGHGRPAAPAPTAIIADAAQAASLADPWAEAKRQETIEQARKAHRMAGKDPGTAGALTFLLLPVGAIYTWGWGLGLLITLGVIVAATFLDLYYVLAIDLGFGILAYYSVSNARKEWERHTRE